MGPAMEQVYQLTPMGPARRCLRPSRCTQNWIISRQSSSTVNSTCHAPLPSACRRQVLSKPDRPLSLFIGLPHSPTVSVPWRKFRVWDKDPEVSISEFLKCSVRRGKPVGPTQKISLFRAAVLTRYWRDKHTDRHTDTRRHLIPAPT